MADTKNTNEISPAAGATMSDDSSRRAPTMREAREIMKGLFEHRPVIYWIDMTVSALIGWGGLALAISRPTVDALTVLGVVVSAFAFLRAVLFIHELSHFRRGVMPGFSAAWNLLVGVPMLLPSFMYVGSHTDHHKRHLYGTVKDPEYLPLGHFSRWRVVFFLLETLVVPLLLILRFGVLSPISWCMPALRGVVVARASSLVINPDFKRAMPPRAEHRRWIGLEFLIWIWVGGVTWALVDGLLPLRALFIWAAMAALLALVNQVRTLTAHLYDNEGEEMTTEAQLLDSVNVRGMPIITELVFPVGLRFHALHHFVPDMPYHGLAEAHRRLMKELPEGSRYRETDYQSSLAVIGVLWKKARKGGGLPAAWKKAKSGDA